MISLPSPTVEFLKRLVPNSLKQSLPKAVRLWVILHGLYDDDRLYSEIPDRFTYKDWEHAFFSASHRFGRDEIPAYHDAQCACARSITAWLFEGARHIEPTPWMRSFCTWFDLDTIALQQLLNKSDRLFAITRRSLESDFEALVKLGCLTFQQKSKGAFYKNRYQKVTALPTILSEPEFHLNFATAAEFIQTDLSEFVDSLAQPIQGVQRFFLHTEYVVSNRLSDRISDYQAQLKACWNRSEPNPIYLQYRSARQFQEELDWIVYPVCVFYYQRAPYLFAYGYRMDDRPAAEPIALEWYDFRLDHIEALQQISWQDSRLHPTFLTQRQQSPTPDQIHHAMAETWGFEFYRPADCLLLRFDRYFYANYIAPTERATLFTLLTLSEVITQINKLTHPQQRKMLQQILAQRNAADIYCRIRYRVGDRNILMRLRAWGPNVEVILPYTLREQIAIEIQTLAKLYGRET
jgi:CRISPR-associated protein (TIGR03985 family)